MAKTYTFTDLPQPTNCTATATTGGSLAANTYYYRVIGVYSTLAHYAYKEGQSKVSAEFSVTTDATNNAVEISFDSPLGDNNAYKIWRQTVSSDGLITIGCIAFYPKDVDYNTAGVVTFTDTGYASTTNNYLDIASNTHGRLEISGSTYYDKFGIIDLYNADVANGWGVIDKIDYNTYRVNTKLVVNGENWWADYKKTIVFQGGLISNSDFNCQFGILNGEQTYNGCNIIFSQTTLETFKFGELNAYSTSFEYTFQFDYTAQGLGYIAFYSGTLQDCNLHRFRGVSPLGGSNCIFKNTIISRFDNLFYGNTPTVNGLNCYRGSRVWQLSGSKSVVARGLLIDGSNGVLCINAYGSLTIIDSIINGSPMFGNYSGNNGFMYYDKFSYNLTVYEEKDTTPIEGVLIKVYDNSDTEVFSETTDSDGKIDEQLITRVEGTVDSTSGTSVYTYTDKSPYKVIMEKEGYETYNGTFERNLSLPVLKTTSLKKAVPVMIGTNGNFVVKIDPKNSGINRDKVI